MTDPTPAGRAPRRSRRAVPQADDANTGAPTAGERFPPLPDELDAQAQRDAERAAARAALQPKRRRRNIPPSTPEQVAGRNRVTALFTVLSIALVAYFVMLWNDPYSALNPFAPPTPFPVIVSMTPTPSLTPTASPTLSPTPTRTPSPTLTARATQTPIPSATFTPIPAAALGVTFLPGAPETAAALTGTPNPDASASGDGYPFTLIPAGLIYIANPEGRGGCNWSSIAGSVSDAAGDAVDGYTVRIVGENVDATVLSGSNRGFGGGGYELPLGETARAATYTVTLYDPAGVQVSAAVTADTRADCANITAVRFVGR
jgi:hypothetical protein